MKLVPRPPDDIRNYLAYDPELGVFTWIARASTCIHVGSEAGCIKRRGYRHIRFRDVNYGAARLAWWFETGNWPEDFQVDHKNRDPSDNRIANLRLATAVQNRANVAKTDWRKRRKLSSSFKGVCFMPGVPTPSKPWRATITHNHKTTDLGRFATEREAADAYARAAQELQGEFAVEPPKEIKQNGR